MTRWVTRLLIANGAVFLAQLAAGPNLGQFIGLFGFVPNIVLRHPWSLVTYMFLHGGFMHILFNMLMLFFFGPRLEMRLTAKKFLALYFLSGITGALLYLPFNWGSPIPLIGASGAIYGVMLGFAYFWPREKIYIWGIVPIESRVLIVLMTALSLYFGIRGGGNIAHFAHLGGFLGGFLYLKYIEHTSPAKRWKKQIKVPVAPVGHGGNHSDIERWSRIRAEQLHEVNRDEVVRLLEKARRDGASSLTPAERDCLNRFSPTT